MKFASWKSHQNTVLGCESASWNSSLIATGKLQTKEYRYFSYFFTKIYAVGLVHIFLWRIKKNIHFLDEKKVISGAICTCTRRGDRM